MNNEYNFDDISFEKMESFIRGLKKFGKNIDRLIEKYSPEKFEPLPDAEERLSKVKQVCEKVVDQHHGTMELKHIPTELGVNIRIEIPMLSFTKELLDGFSAVADYLTDFIISPKDDLLKIELDVKYYKGDVSPVELAMRELENETL